MRITKRRLRRITREEVRALSEAPSRPPSYDRLRAQPDVLAYLANMIDKLPPYLEELVVPPLYQENNVRR